MSVHVFKLKTILICGVSAKSVTKTSGHNFQSFLQQTKIETFSGIIKALQSLAKPEDNAFETCTLFCLTG